MLPVGIKGEHMKVIEAINAADRLKPNMYTLPDKIKWLSRLERRIFNEVFLTHELSDEEMRPFLPEDEGEEGDSRPEDDPNFVPGLPGPEQSAEHALDLEPGFFRKPRPKLVLEPLNDGDGDKDLIVGEPWDEMYVHWLSAQIDWYNMETDGFNNSNAMFESVYQDYKRWFNRNHMPLTERKIYY